MFEIQVNTILKDCSVPEMPSCFPLLVFIWPFYHVCEEKR